MLSTWDWGGLQVPRELGFRNIWSGFLWHWQRDRDKGPTPRPNTHTQPPCLTWAPRIEEQNEFPELVGCDRPFEGVNVNLQEVSTHSRCGWGTQTHLQRRGPVGLQWGHPGAGALMICQAEHSPSALGQVWQRSWKRSRAEALWGNLPAPENHPPTNAYTPLCASRVLTSVRHKDDVVQAWLEAAAPEVQNDVECLAPANNEVVGADLLCVVLHVVPGALEVCDGQLQPCDGAAGADKRAGLGSLVQSCPPLTSCANLRKKLSLSDPQSPSR